jgi:DNA repair ATPase RecN
MIKVMNLRELSRFVFMMSMLLVVVPSVSTAQDRAHEFQGYYSNKLKSSLDIINSKIRKNLGSYKKDKSVARLDESYKMIIKSVDEMDNSLKDATRQLDDISGPAEMAKLSAQIDKLEVINIRDVELPYLCDQLYAVGLLYIKADKTKAKQSFTDIVNKFTSYECGECSRKAEYALKRLK